jgi:hypothetical protein
MKSRALLFALTMLGASMGTGIGMTTNSYSRREDFLDNAANRVKQILPLPQSEQVGQLGKHIQTVTFTHNLGKYDISYTIDIVANSPKAITKKIKLYSFQISHYISSNYNKEHLESKGFIVEEPIVLPAEGVKGND